MSETDDERQRRAAAYAEDPIAVNRWVIEEYRAHDGQVPGMSGPSRMLLLTTKGARTGQERTTPMMYVAEGDRLVVFASNAGARRAPAWYHNLVRDSDVAVEVGSERFAATATVTSGEERERLWRLFPFPEHQERAQRLIPVVVLERRHP